MIALMSPHERGLPEALRALAAPYQPRQHGRRQIRGVYRRVVDRKKAKVDIACREGSPLACAGPNRAGEDLQPDTGSPRVVRDKVEHRVAHVA
jgi:hypothetical protein